MKANIVEKTQSGEREEELKKREEEEVKKAENKQFQDQAICAWLDNPISQEVLKYISIYRENVRNEIGKETIKKLEEFYQIQAAERVLGNIQRKIKEITAL